MKRLAVMGSGNGSNFEEIVNWFQSKNIDNGIEITCLSDVEDALILKRAEKLGINCKYLPFEQNSEYFGENKFDLVALAGYMRILPENVLKIMGKVINIHPSLLPSFKGKDAINKAFLSGVKLSGVTIHWAEKSVDEGKIIAQYPVFIHNGMHLDEFEEQIHTIEHKLYPIVIEKVLEDKVFDFQDLIRGKGSGESSSCGGCGKCKH
ncbi:MAG: formyltransferase family protein [Candidatus Gastranaerophilaceae bacterium]